MNRVAIAATILASMLAGCGTVGSAGPLPTAAPSPTPSAAVTMGLSFVSAANVFPSPLTPIQPWTYFAIPDPYITSGYPAQQLRVAVYLDTPDHSLTAITKPYPYPMFAQRSGPQIQAGTPVFITWPGTAAPIEIGYVDVRQPTQTGVSVMFASGTIYGHDETATATAYTYRGTCLAVDGDTLAHGCPAAIAFAADGTAAPATVSAADAYITTDAAGASTFHFPLGAVEIAQSTSAPAFAQTLQAPATGAQTAFTATDLKNGVFFVIATRSGVPAKWYPNQTTSAGGADISEAYGPYAVADSNDGFAF